MMEYYDKYLHHLWDKADALETERQRLQAILDEEKQKLVKLEQAVKVLEKHKEKFEWKGTSINNETEQRKVCPKCGFSVTDNYFIQNTQSGSKAIFLMPLDIIYW